MSNKNTYLRMISFLKPYTVLLIISLFLTLTVVIFDGASLWFSGSLIQSVFSENMKPPPVPSFELKHAREILKLYTWKLLTFNNSGGSFDILKRICILIPLLFILKNIFLIINSLIVKTVNFKVIRNIRNRFFRHLMDMPISFFDITSSEKLISMTVKDIGTLNNAMATTILKLMLEPCRLIVFISLLIILNIKLTLIVFIIYPVLTFLLAKLSKSIKKKTRKMLSSFSGLVGILGESVKGIRIVKMFNMSKKEYEAFSRENNRFTKRNFRAEALKITMAPMTETLAMFVTAILLWYGGKNVLSGSSNFGSEDFIRYLIILFSSYTPLKKLSNVYGILYNGIAAAERVFKVLDKPEEDIRPKPGIKTESFTDRISFNGVSFNYPGHKNNVLENISFDIFKGEQVAIVGGSGAGKSTILDLLPRFYDINSGSITIDGKNIKDIYLYDLRKLFGIVSQDTILFNNTIKSNIAYGVTYEASDKEITAAAEASNAAEFIDALPEKYDTTVGEKGILLSGGQKQRISIARALLKNPDILILDEATSSLDTESERYVQKAVDYIMQNRTAVMVAHRLSTIKHADKILLLDNGRISSAGTHEELYEKSPKYKYYYDLQIGD